MRPREREEEDTPPEPPPPPQPSSPAVGETPPAAAAAPASARIGGGLSSMIVRPSESDGASDYDADDAGRRHRDSTPPPRRRRSSPQPRRRDSPPPFRRRFSPPSFPRRGSPPPLVRRGSPPAFHRRGPPPTLVRRYSPPSFHRRGSPSGFQPRNPRFNGNSGQKLQGMPLEKVDQTASPLASSNQTMVGSHEETDARELSADDRLGGNIAEKARIVSRSVIGDVQKTGRPMSPGTLSLMCDEQDLIFTTSQSSSAPSRHLHNQNITDVYAEQEKHVLTGLRDYLVKLVAYGRDKEASFLATTIPETSNQQESAVNIPSTAEVTRSVNAFSASSDNFLPPNFGRPRIDNGYMKPNNKIL